MFSLTVLQTEIHTILTLVELHILPLNVLFTHVHWQAGIGCRIIRLAIANNIFTMVSFEEIATN